MNGEPFKEDQKEDDPLRAAEAAADTSSSSLNYSNHELPSFLNNKVNDFLKDLTKPKYAKPLSTNELIAMFQRFYKDFHQAAEVYVKGSVKSQRVELKDFQKASDDDDDDDLKIKNYTEIAEYRVCSALYDRLFVKNEDNLKINGYINDKISIFNKIKDLDYKQLIDVHDVDLKLPILEQISNDEFQLFQTLKSPLQKLSILITIHSKLNEFLKEHLHSNMINGDYLLPLLIYLILINDSQHDYYLNFAYIKSFRNESYLIGDALFCLTNLEAALTFIQNYNLLEYDQFEPPLTNKEELIRLNKDSMIVNHTTNFLSNAFDSSFKLVNRFKPDTTDVDLINNNPIKNFMGDVMRWTRTSTPVSSASREIRSRSASLSSTILKSVGSSSTINTLGNDQNNSIVNNVAVDLNRFKDKKFNELTISELHALFDDYQTLTKTLRKS